MYGIQTQEQVEVDVLEKEIEKYTIVLYNDHENTFDFVIDALVDLCAHDTLQAEQCAFLVHYKGKCAVKSGGFSKIEPICHQLLDRGLTVEIE